MSTNKSFGKVTEARIKDLVDHAEIHKETHHVAFKLPTELSEKKELKFGSEVEVIEHAVDLVNGYGLAVEAATFQIGKDQFPETKIEAWDGRLAMFDGLTVSSDVHLREVVGEDTIYGATQTFIDHPHTQEMVDWYSAFRDRNVELATNLFKD